MLVVVLAGRATPPRAPRTCQHTPWSSAPRAARAAAGRARPRTTVAPRLEQLLQSAITCIFGIACSLDARGAAPAFTARVQPTMGDNSETQVREIARLPENKICVDCSQKACVVFIQKPRHHGLWRECTEYNVKTTLYVLLFCSRDRRTST